MGLFSNQFSNVVEWNETREGVLFYKWQNQEIPCQVAGAIHFQVVH